MEIVSKLELNKISPKEDYILFDEPSHTYSLKNKDITFTSATQFISKFFEEFDADKIIDTIRNSSNFKEGHKYWGKTKNEIKFLWETKRDQAAELGTNMHKLIESYLNDKKVPTNEPEMGLFYEWYADWDAEIYRTELIVYDEDLKLAGSIDSIWKISDDKYVMVDWKRCEKPINERDGYGKYGKPPICNLKDNSFYHYALQQSLYRYLLEKSYDFHKISRLYLLQLHPNQAKARLIEVPYLKEEIKAMLKNETSM